MYTGFLREILRAWACAFTLACSASSDAPTGWKPLMHLLLPASAEKRVWYIRNVDRYTKGGGCHIASPSSVFMQSGCNCILRVEWVKLI